MLLCLTACAAIFAILAIASSRQLEQANPQLALKLYPLNAEALLAEGVEALDAAGGGAVPKAMEDEVRAAIPHHAGDARLYSLLGELMRRRGQETAAYAMFDHALLLAKTEIHALQWAIQRAVEGRDYLKATNQMDTLFRRWPERIEPLATAVPAIYARPDAYSILLARIGANPPWRRGLINALTADSAQNSDFAASLLQGLAASPSPPTPSETARVLASLVRREQYDLAYRTFLLTLGPQERNLSGFVFDGAFRQGPSGRVFDWSVRQQPGVTLALPAEGDLVRAGGGLSLAFSETPVLGVGIEQHLLLAPGGYAIGFSASAFAAHLPKGLIWSLRCANSGRLILKLDVPAGNYTARSVETRFAVPENCPVQILDLRTNAIAESWSERYSGRILFHDIHVSSVQS